MHPLESLGRWKRAGLLTELQGAEAERLIPHTSTPPAPSPALIRAYYDAGGDSVESAWRRQQDRYIEIPVGACPEAVADQLENAFPAIGGVRVRVTAHELIVRSRDDVVSVARVVRHRRLDTRQLRRPVDGPRHVVQAVNAILGRRGAPHRFIELKMGRGRHAFVGVEATQAQALYGWGATAYRDLETLSSFAGWRTRERARAAS